MTVEAGAERFWNFSLALYGRPGVAPACLSLQDRCGLDVNLLLFCCWSAAEGRMLPEPALRAAIAAAAPWQEAVLQPLRAVRRRLKSGLGAVPEVRSEPLRRRLADLELEAERIEQQVLATVAGATAAGAPLARTGAVNLGLYLRLCGVEPGPAERAALAAILAAAFPAADPADLSFGASG